MDFGVNGVSFLMAYLKVLITIHVFDVYDYTDNDITVLFTWTGGDPKMIA